MKCLVCKEMIPVNDGVYVCDCGAQYTWRDGQMVEFDYEGEGARVIIGGISNIGSGTVNISPGKVSVTGIRPLSSTERTEGSNNFLLVVAGVAIMVALCILLILLLV